MKIFLPAFLLLMISIGCSKYKELKASDDLNGNLYYSGQLQFANDLDSSGIFYEKINTHVRLYKKSDTNRYLFDTLTDDHGYFYFRNLKADTNYFVSVSEKISSSAGNVLYDAKQYFTPIKDKVDTAFKVKPSRTNQNGVVFTVVDSTTAHGPIVGCMIYLYSSQVQANDDSTYTGSNAIVLGPTNSLGKAAKVNIATQTYYVRLKAGTNLVGRDIVTVGQVNNQVNNIIERSDTLRRR